MEKSNFTNLLRQWPGKRQRSSHATGLRLCHDESMKRQPVYTEGPEAFTRFQEAMRTALSVPHSVIQQRIEQERRQSAQNPNRRGPKPRAKS